MSRSWSRFDRPLRGESSQSFKAVTLNSHNHFWRFGIRLESMDYCGSESLAAIEREWLVFSGIRISPPFFSSRLTVQNWQITDASFAQNSSQAGKNR